MTREPKDDAGQGGWVTHVQRFSLHDGPGVRTTIFLQGCNLACGWCHNPETLSLSPVLLHHQNRCVGCGCCVKVCPAGALSMREGRAVLDRSRCRSCFACTAVCPGQALAASSRRMAVAEVVEAAGADRRFYENSGGGVTVSGGEPMMQPAFTGALLKALRAAGLHTALDTAGLQPYARYAAVMEDVDLFLVDYKAFDEDLHRALTGVPNGLIRENIARLSREARAMWVRVPVIPGANDDEDQMRKIAGDLRRLGFAGLVEPLAFHSLGQAKYDALGRPYAFTETDPPDDERMDRIRGIFLEHGLNVRQPKS